MKNVFKDAQKGLRDFFRYTGKIDGVIGRQSETSLNRIHFVANTGWDRERKALAYVQFRLNSKGEKLTIDGLWGAKSANAWKKHHGSGPPPPKGKGLMPTSVVKEIIHDLRWNHSSRPTLNPVGIVLHRTAGYFKTGDYKAGKYGNPRGSSAPWKSVGFHFLVGKELGEIIQFCSINKHVSHVKKWAASYVGIEISGDVGQYKDGLIHGEPMTDWQLETVAKIVDWISKEKNIPLVRINHKKQMFQESKAFHGLLSHRDLDGNDHADSPNNADWKELMRRLGA